MEGYLRYTLIYMVFLALVVAFYLLVGELVMKIFVVHSIFQVCTFFLVLQKLLKSKSYNDMTVQSFLLCRGSGDLHNLNDKWIF